MNTTFLDSSSGAEAILIERPEAVPTRRVSLATIGELFLQLLTIALGLFFGLIAAFVIALIVGWIPIC